MLQGDCIYSDSKWSYEIVVREVGGDLQRYRYDQLWRDDIYLRLVSSIEVGKYQKIRLWSHGAACKRGGAGISVWLAG